MNKAGSADRAKFAAALEGLTITDMLGHQVTMRKDDHQILTEYFVGVFTKGVKYDSEKTGLGWKTETTVLPKDLDQPNTCNMKRPRRRRNAPHRPAPARPTLSPPGRGQVTGRGQVDALMEVLLVSLLNGLVYGMLLFMLASGLTLIFSMMGVLNFAHASMYMLGAYFAYSVSRLIGFWPALVLAPRPVRRCSAPLIEMYGAAPRPPERPHRRAAVHLRPGLHHREGRCRWRGAAAGALPRAGRCSTSRCSRSTARTSTPIAASCC